MMAIAVIVLTACVSTGYRQDIEVKAGGSVEERLEIAKGFATADRLDELRKQIKAQLPGTTDRQLSSMALLWNDVRTAKPDGTLERLVTITLTLEERDGVNGSEVMRIASHLIVQDLNQIAAASPVRREPWK